MSDVIGLAPNAEYDRFVWVGPAGSVAYDERGIWERLLQLDQPCYVVYTDAGIGVAIGDMILPSGSAQVPAGAVAGRVVAGAPALTPAQLGDMLFKQTHRVEATYAAGSMANGIASEQLVTALGSARILSSFGAAGLSLGRLQEAIWRIQQALPSGPYAFNLIHSPNDGDLEQQTVALYLKHGVTTIEASAYLKLTPPLVHYRVAGLKQDSQGKLVIANKIIAKASHEHVALQFLQPPPPALLSQLVRAGLITTTQANLAQYVPIADDLTVEADSGGHTDNQPLVCILPNMIALRDNIQARFRYPHPVRVGAAGGIGTPSAALAAYMMGAAYVVTGSINQASIEAGTSQHTKQLLAQATMTDTIMAPSADMFEQGVKVQLLKKGTLYPMQAQKLFDLYRQYDSIEAIPAAERERIERLVFKKSISVIWDEVIAYFQARDAGQILRARDNPKHRMALIFRWYLGLSSHWASVAEPGRELDYQIWCGPAMGAFNDWVRGSYLEAPDQRHVVDMAHQIMRGAALLYRVQHLRLQGVQLPAALSHYRPMPQPNSDDGAIEEDRAP